MTVDVAVAIMLGEESPVIPEPCEPDDRDLRNGQADHLADLHRPPSDHPTASRHRSVECRPDTAPTGPEHLPAAEPTLPGSPGRCLGGTPHVHRPARAQTTKRNSCQAEDDPTRPR